MLDLRKSWEDKAPAEPNSSANREVGKSAGREKGLGSPEGSPSHNFQRRMNSALRRIRHQPLAEASGMKNFRKLSLRVESLNGKTLNL